MDDCMVRVQPGGPVAAAANRLGDLAVPGGQGEVHGLARCARRAVQPGYLRARRREIIPERWVIRLGRPQLLF